MKKVLVLAIALTLALTVCAMAAGTSPNAKVAVHVKAHPTSCTKGFPAFATCSAIVATNAGTGDFDFLPVFYDLAQYDVCESGFLWPEADWGSGSWVRCKGDVAVGAIQHSVDQVAQDQSLRGTAVAWSTCQTGYGIATGYCWIAVAGPGKVCPAPNPATAYVGVYDCAQVACPAIMLSCAGMGGLAGDDPCRQPPSAVEQSTWGQIKSVFK